MSIADVLSIPLQAFGGQQTDVVPDGRWAASVTVAVVNVEHNSKTPRTSRRCREVSRRCCAGKVRGKDVVGGSCGGGAATPQKEKTSHDCFSKGTENAPKIRTFLCSRQRYTTGSSSSFRRRTTHHKYSVNPSWPAGLWMKQVL